MVTFCAVLVAALGAAVVGTGLWYAAICPVMNLLTGAGWALVEVGGSLVKVAVEAAVGANR